MKLKQKLILLSAIFFLACYDSQETSQEIEYSFFVAGHIYGRAGVDNVGMHPPFKSKFQMLKVDEKVKFGVFTGDMVLSSTELNWNEIDADIEELGLPIYFAAGNHDLTDRKLYESRYGQTYYSFMHDNDLFLVLDPNLDSLNISGAQLDFLEKEVKKNVDSLSNIFVFFHDALWWEPDNKFKDIRPNCSYCGRARKINFWTKVEPLFKHISNQVYMFAGDFGAFPDNDSYMYHNNENITLIGSGMGGGEKDNFILVDVMQNKTVQFRLIAINGDDINALGKLEEY